MVDSSDYENDSDDDEDDYDDEGGMKRKGKRKRKEKPKKVLRKRKIFLLNFHFEIQVYANAKISNKGYDTSQFVSSFRKALVPIGNQTTISFGSGNSEHVSYRISKFIEKGFCFRKHLFVHFFLNHLKFPFRIIKDRYLVVV